MDSPKNTKIKSKDITDILKGIRKSKSNFKKANIFLSKEEIKRKIESSIKVKEETSSTLSTNEKIRYGKIGSSFIKGTEEYFSYFILKLKREERKKLREQNKNLNFDGFSKEKLIFKETKKKNKALFGTKLALFGAALTGAAYLIKETYDFFVESPKFTKFKKDLENFLPSSIKFYDSGSKTINENPSSFVLTTKNGEEISISDESFSKNPISESASTFDNIILKSFLKDGLGDFINNINEQDGQSIIGYFLFKPFTVYVNRAKKYLYDAIQDPKIGRMYRDVYWQIKWIFNLFDLSILTNQYRGRYNHFKLKSQNETYNSYSKIENILQGLREDGNKDNKGSFDAIPKTILKYKTRTGVDRTLTINSKSFLTISEKIKEIIESGDIIKINSLMREVEKGLDIETRANYIKTNINHLNLGIQVKGSKLLKDEILGIYGHGLYRTYSQSYDDLKETEEEVKILIDNYRESINNTLSLVSKEIPRLLAYHRLNQYYDRQESLVKIMTKNNLEEVKQYETINDNLVYFNKNLKIHQKLNFIIRDYFDNRWKYNNFIHKFMIMMEENTETGVVQMENTINAFKTSFSPHSHLNESLKELDKKDDLGRGIKNYYKNHTVLMGQSSDDNVQYGISNTSFLDILVNYAKTKINFRRTRLKIFKSLLEKTSETVKDISVKFVPNPTS